MLKKPHANARLWNGKRFHELVCKSAIGILDAEGEDLLARLTRHRPSHMKLPRRKDELKRRRLARHRLAQTQKNIEGVKAWIAFEEAVQAVMNEARAGAFD